MRKYYTHIALIGLTAILYFMANFQRVAIPGSIFDVLKNDLALNTGAVTALSYTFMFAYALSLLIVGLLEDRYGGIRVVLGGAIIFSIGGLIFPNTQNIYLLYLSRILTGAGAATFYLTLVQEIKKCFPDRYFGILISVMLITGYLGGVCANAPFVSLSHTYSWKSVLVTLAVITVIVTILFAIFRQFLHFIPSNLHAKFSLQPFKEVLLNPFNRNLYIFAGLNYGLYYVIQTVIGAKFLKDFLNLPDSKTSVILSIMIVVAGVSGITLASLSKLFDNRRVIFMKSICITTTLIFTVICGCLIFNFRSYLVAGLILLVAIGGGMSPLLVPIIHGTNKYEIRGTALSIMNCCFFMTVGILGTLVGVLLEVFEPTIGNAGHLVYSEKSYLLVFSMFILFSLVEMYHVFKLKDIS